MPTFALPPAPKVEIREAPPEKDLKTERFNSRGEAEVFAGTVKGVIIPADGKFVVVWGEAIEKVEGEQ